VTLVAPLAERSPFGEAALIVGRRGGKSRILATIVIEPFAISAPPRRRPERLASWDGAAPAR
jgi:hypothetical protein